AEVVKADVHPRHPGAEHAEAEGESRGHAPPKRHLQPDQEQPRQGERGDEEQVERREGERHHEPRRQRRRGGEPPRKAHRQASGPAAVSARSSPSDRRLTLTRCTRRLSALSTSTSMPAKRMRSPRRGTRANSPTTAPPRV